VATLKWNEQPRVGLRWNGEEGESGKGNPQSRGMPRGLLSRINSQRKFFRLLEDFDRQRKLGLPKGTAPWHRIASGNQEAMDWSEALIGDASEAR